MDYEECENMEAYGIYNDATPGGKVCVEWNRFWQLGLTQKQHSHGGSYKISIQVVHA